MHIESVQNGNVKRARALAHRKGRQEQGLHFLEGEKLVREAIVSNAELVDAFIEEGHDAMAEALLSHGVNVFTVKRGVMESLALTNTPQWVCATAKTPQRELPEHYPHGLIVALDRVQDPGNLGTVIRTADAMGAAGLVLGPGCADPYAPKPIRAAMGSVYHVPVWEAPDLCRELAKLKNEGFALICGHLEGEEALPDIGGKCVLVIGNEGNGVSDAAAKLCFCYRLPMYGFAESLNASVAAGIMMFELARRMRE